MPDENVEIVRRVYEMMNAADEAAAEKLLSPDVVWVPDPRVGHDPWEGRDAVIGFFRDQAEMFEDLHIEIERLFDAGDRVVAFIRITGEGRTSRAPMQIRIGHVWTIRDGTAVKGEGFGDRDEALEAAGLEDEV